MEPCVYQLAEETKSRLKAFITDIARSTPERHQEIIHRLDLLAGLVNGALIVPKKGGAL